MRKKLKGSALLWAVCSLLIVAFVLTGLLAINKSYAQEEIENVAGRRAEYLARSGIELTADMVKKNELTEGTSYDEITRYKEVVVTYKWGTADRISVTVERTGGDAIRLISEANAGDVRRSVTGMMEYTTLSNKWELKGYAAN